MSPDTWVAIFTGLLWVTTAILAFYTFRLWRATHSMSKDAKATADRQASEMQESLAIARESSLAAKQSVRLAREEFISTHRPKIILRDAICTDNEIGNQIVVSYTLVNIGETRARIVLWGAEVQLITNEAFDLPQTPSMAEGWHEGFGGAVLEPGEERTGKHYSICHWRTDDGSRHGYEEQRRGLFFCGHLVYEDDRNIRRHTAFWRKYDLTTSRFYLVNHPTLAALDYAD